MFGSYFKTTFYNFKDEFQNVFVYMTSATGDYFFMPDETHLWWHGFEENKFPRKILRLIPKAEHSMAGHLDSLIADTSLAMVLAKADKDYRYKDQNGEDQSINWSDVDDLDMGVSLFGQDFSVNNVDSGVSYNFEVSNVGKVLHVNLWALQSHESHMRDFRIGRISNRARNETTYETKDLQLALKQ